MYQFEVMCICVKSCAWCIGLKFCALVSNYLYRFEVMCIDLIVYASVE